MASYTLSLYKASSSIYDLDVAPLSIEYTPESSYVWEEARLIIEAPLAIMAPPNSMSVGSSLKSTACSKAPQGGSKEKKTTPAHPTTGAIGLKRKGSSINEPSKHSHVMPSGTHASSSIPSARPSLSYTIVRVCKPKGVYGKALMHKSAKKPKSKTAPSGKESELSDAPLRIKKFRKLPPIKRPARQYESSDDEDAPSKGPTIASPSAKNEPARTPLGP
jgi:hypothetical protein